jgi:hypothetical protein
MAVYDSPLFLERIALTRCHNLRLSQLYAPSLSLDTIYLFQPGTNINLSQEKGCCTLTIAKSSPKESGEYTLTAKNSVGSVTCAAKLTVKEADIPPMIEKGFKDLTVDAGKSSTFECSISGKPSPDVAWSLNGQPVKVSL